MARRPMANPSNVYLDLAGPIDTYLEVTSQRLMLTQGSNVRSSLAPRLGPAHPPLVPRSFAGDVFGPKHFEGLRAALTRHGELRKGYVCAQKAPSVRRRGEPGRAEGIPSDREV